MNIEFNDAVNTLSQLEAGEAFRLMDKVYIKTDEETPKGITVVNLSNGNVFSMPALTRIEKFNCIIVE